MTRRQAAMDLVFQSQYYALITLLSTYAMVAAGICNFIGSAKPQIGRWQRTYRRDTGVTQRKVRG